MMLVTANHPSYSQGGDTIFRWVNSQGKVVLSDRPPPDPSTHYEVVSKSELVASHPSVRDESTSNAGLKELSSGPTQRAQRPEITKDPKICEVARRNINALNTYARIRVPNEAGEMVYLTEEEKAEQRAKAEALALEHCA